MTLMPNTNTANDTMPPYLQILSVTINFFVSLLPAPFCSVARSIPFDCREKFPSRMKPHFDTLLTRTILAGNTATAAVRTTMVSRRRAAGIATVTSGVRRTTSATRWGSATARTTSRDGVATGEGIRMLLHAYITRYTYD